MFLLLLTVIAGPTEPIRGELQLPAGATAPAALELQYQSPAGTPSGAAIPKASVACPVVERRWQCEVPAARLDVRLSADGFAPLYYWDVQPGDLGAAKLERGASVSGWIARERPSDEPVPVPVTVELHAAQFEEPRGARASLHPVQHSGQANARGFFQLRAVPAGTYTLVAKAKDASTAHVDDVRVEAGEVVLRDAVLLPPLATLTVRVTPPAPPDAGVWRTQLLRVTSQRPGLERTASGTTDDLGVWTHPRVERGHYDVVISDPRGSVAASRRVEIGSEEPHVTITIGSVAIEGIVRLGEEPLAAKLAFESEGRSVTLRSDDGGAFAGTLPEEGTWSARITPDDALQQLRIPKVEVRLRDGASAVRLDLELPGGRIEGLTVDRHDRPVPNANIMITRAEQLVGAAATDADGRFRIDGLEPGPVAIRAWTDEIDGPTVRHEVSEHVTETLKLVLHERTRLEGTLVRANGTPVAGAMIRGIVAGRPVQGVTGPSGIFRLELPAGATSIDATILAPGLPAHIIRLMAGGRDEVVVRTSHAAGSLYLQRPSRTPMVRRGSAAVPLFLLFAPHGTAGPPREFDGDGFRLTLEPGDYTVCADGTQTRCVPVSVVPGGEAVVPLEDLQ
ncbi:MAG TPA: carboxypeptidase-like regulatory domain-containing protein [Thermoanaerobaculia bacterium]